jgi:hypothetical protein
LIGLSTNKSIYFYDWDNCSFIRRIEIVPTNIFWKGNNLIISTEESFFHLKYNHDLIQNLIENEKLTIKGIFFHY